MLITLFRLSNSIHALWFSTLVRSHVRCTCANMVPPCSPSPLPCSIHKQMFPPTFICLSTIRPPATGKQSCSCCSPLCAFPHPIKPAWQWFTQNIAHAQVPSAKRGWGEAPCCRDPAAQPPKSGLLAARRSSQSSTRSCIVDSAATPTVPIFSVALLPCGTELFLSKIRLE